MQTEIISIPSRRIPWRRILPSIIFGSSAIAAGTFGLGKGIGNNERNIADIKTYTQQAQVEKRLLTDLAENEKNMNALLEEKQHLESILDEQIETFKDMQDKITELSQHNAEMLKEVSRIPELEANIETLTRWNEHLKYCIEQKKEDLCWTVNGVNSSY